MIDWTKGNILKINKDVNCFDNTEIDETKIASLRGQIEPWLTSIFQSEHFSLLVGTGLTLGLANLASITAQGMSRIDFTNFKDEIKDWSNESAKLLGRGSANIEDDFRTSLELLQGLIILKDSKATELEKEINVKLNSFIRAIVKTENDFVKSETFEDALSLLKSFLISFASRAASRERTNIFTTNYDRFIEYGLDNAGILTIDRFIGKIRPTFRNSKLELDYHYNPPGIRGEPRYVEGVVRYTKLHGSIDWSFENDLVVKLALPFGINEDTETIPKSPKNFSVIYPNSSKGIDTAYFPYSELFRDFSSSICRPNSAIVTYGYGFGDSHLNRIIKDMLTIPSTHLVMISYDLANGRIQKFLDEINPAQVTLLIGSNLGSIKSLVDNYLPKAAIDRIQERMFRNLDRRHLTTKPDDHE